MLTKELILEKYSNKSDITTIKNLNIWGADLQDISILSNMTNLEYLCLSSNKISSLSPLSACTNLREIYLRNNNIDSYEELDYLKPLLNLKVLWLEGNPICDDIYYREKVLAKLPQVILVDNKKRSYENRIAKINIRRRFQSEDREKRKNENDYDANLTKSNRKKIIMRRVFSYFDQTNEDKIVETSNEINIKSNKNNLFFDKKRGDQSDLKIIFNNKKCNNNKIFKKLKLKLKLEEKNSNFGLYNNNINNINIKMVNNFIVNGNKISKKKLTVETNPVKIPRIKYKDKERDSYNIQNATSIDTYKGNIFRNVNNEKINLNYNCYNNNYAKKDIYFLLDKMNVNDLISLKNIINQRISLLTKN